MKKISILLSFCLVLSSCEKEIDYQIPDPGDKIVVSANLENGETAKIYLSTSVYSMLAVDPRTDDIYTARLFTDDPNSPFELSPQLEVISGFDSLYFYSAPHIISEGKSYRIEVSAPNLESITASTIVPAIKQIENVLFDPVSNELTFNFKDNASQDDFYLIEIKASGEDYGLFFSSADPSLNFFDFEADPLGGSGDGRSYGREAFFDDNQFQGKSKVISVRLEGLDEGNQFYVYLHHISESYYRFRLTKQAASANSFFGEPVQIFSNVIGGYGILAGRSNSRILVTY